ncbi:MAG TPA: hypothetical protein DC012_02410 [Escherichia sp.]|uniref:hypothetical protein n=1 Tax=Pseudescherichia vulneris TaxID=566 RepID=UPI000E807233|nr:hypothetical protein [Pseudescherichia vulneris]HBC80823.1 hypothetical protein [Escherichia sp.]
MKKILIGLAVAVLVSIIVLAIAWPDVKMEFASYAQYTEQDTREYEYFTPDLLKNMPRITNDYRFEYGNVTGPEAHVFTVHIYGTTDSSTIRDYLRAQGYEPQKVCDVEAECWRSHKNSNVVTIAKFVSPEEVFIQLSQSPYNEPLTDAE